MTKIGYLLSYYIHFHLYSTWSKMRNRPNNLYRCAAVDGLSIIKWLKKNRARETSFLQQGRVYISWTESLLQFRGRIIRPRPVSLLPAAHLLKVCSQSLGKQLQTYTSIASWTKKEKGPARMCTQVQRGITSLREVAEVETSAQKRKQAWKDNM